jgi:phosphatidylinositol phospholipase C delta
LVLISLCLPLVPIENIKEIRTGSDARYYRQQFQLAQEYEDRWLTIVYILDGAYKTLHLIVATKDVFQIWNKTLRELHAIRQELMRGIGNIEVREALWEKQHWAGEERDQKLTFEEIVRLCRRLNINSNQEDLFRLFTVSGECFPCYIICSCPCYLASRHAASRISGL